MRLSAVLFVILCCAPVSAEVTLGDAVWEVALQVKKKRRDFHALKQWLLPPSPQVKVRPRVTVHMSNSHKKPVSALLLRYAFSARLRRIGHPDEEGVWTVPFEVEERRVPRVKGRAEASVSLPMNRVVLRTYLRRIYHSGYWPVAFKVRVMVEPRPGESFANRIIERELPVLWKANGRNHE
jgi:hypothetical protein